MDKSYPAVPGSVPVARARVAALAEAGGASDERLISVRLAVSEALTNAVEHARDDAGEVHVLATVVSGQLVVVVADDGRGSRGMGFGLTLIATCSDHFMVSTTLTGGVEVEMRFDLEATDSAFSPVPALASAL